MSNAATRLITLIFLLQNQPNQKASDLAEKLGVSQRTVHRYFEMLDEMGIPVYAERGPYGGFSLVRGYKIPPLIFSLEEAVAVYLGTSLVSEMWGQLYRDAAQGAMAKLENILPNEQRGEIDWARRSLVATSLHRADLNTFSPILEDLRRAAREQHQVSAIYQSAANAEATKRRIDPYALVIRAGLWYLVGYCHLREAPRTFRVDRIQKLSVLSQSFQIPENFDIHEYLQNEFKDQPIIRARLRFTAEAAYIAISNRVIWESAQENPDGSLDVILSGPDLPWLASMTLSFANLVTVLEPPELRTMVREWAQATVNLYPSHE
ncbi:MAG TPA: YafY family protein [Anaerolineales bacterium]|nr:YafY family protein [Anaerolineales bacterium]